MGYACYQINSARDGGYGVPAYCDYPGCMKEIDRGVSYMCGDNPHGGDEFGCGNFFCTDHLWHRQPRGHYAIVQNCNRCRRYRTPYKKLSPEHPEWLSWKLKDESWQQWRDENPKEVEEAKAYLASLPPAPAQHMGGEK